MWRRETEKGFSCSQGSCGRVWTWGDVCYLSEAAKQTVCVMEALSSPPDNASEENGTYPRVCNPRAHAQTFTHTRTHTCTHTRTHKLLFHILSGNIRPKLSLLSTFSGSVQYGVGGHRCRDSGLGSKS